MVPLGKLSNQAKRDINPTFQKWIASIELEIGIKLKALHLSNGDEYTSREFSDFCKPKGVQREFTMS